MNYWEFEAILSSLESEQRVFDAENRRSPFEGYCGDWFDCAMEAFGERFCALGEDYPEFKAMYYSAVDSLDWFAGMCHRWDGERNNNCSGLESSCVYWIV